MVIRPLAASLVVLALSSGCGTADEAGVTRSVASPRATIAELLTPLDPGKPAFTTDKASEQRVSRKEMSNLVLRFQREPGTRLDRAVLWVLKPGAVQPTGPDASNSDVLRTLMASAQPDDAEEVTFAFDGLDQDGQALPVGSYGLGFAMVGELPAGQTASVSGPYGSLRIQ